jgi:anthranilate phosphoribosyltransferase
VPTWPGLLTALLRHETLTATDAAWAMGQVMSGEATSAQVGAFAVALRAKGESPEEVGGLVEAMLAAAEPLAVEGPAVDTCGTGGDRAHTVNISTMAALVVAGTGTVVVKHGNRAASSACGSADLLEELGVVVDLPPDAVAASVAEAGIGFCFAPVFHPGMRHAAAPRRELGIPTVFNFLGPLTNPARPDAQAVGCSDPRLAGVMAGVLAARGTTALVFRGDDGLDELTPTTTSRVWTVTAGRVEETSLDPRDLGLSLSALEDLRGGDARRNAAVARAVLGGERGAVREAVVLNAAAALAARRGLSGGTQDLHEALREGLDRATEALDSGAAARTLDGWVSVSRRLGQR